MSRCRRTPSHRSLASARRSRSIPQFRRWPRSMAAIRSIRCTSGSARRSSCADAWTSARRRYLQWRLGPCHRPPRPPRRRPGGIYGSGGPELTTASARCRWASTLMATRTRTAHSTAPSSTARSAKVRSRCSTICSVAVRRPVHSRSDGSCRCRSCLLPKEADAQARTGHFAAQLPASLARAGW